MKTSSLWTIVIITMVAAFISGALFNKKDNYDPLANAVVIEHTISPSDSNLCHMDLYDMEHNQLVGRSENTSVYLDNTGNTDTLHVYIYLDPSPIPPPTAPLATQKVK